MRLWGKEKISEDDLIAGCIRDDRKMQHHLYKIFAPPMLGICLRYASSYQEAEDMLQEGFIRAFNNMSRFRNEGTFEGWMKRIFVNTAIEGYRKNHHNGAMMEVGELQNDMVQQDE